MLVATSVLQQSWDNLQTSVVMDAISRQTYVGVGQAGMRALRNHPAKEMAFIINTQDADHPSLTFLDFQGARGKEEGVAVEIGSHGTGRSRESSVDTVGGHRTACYSLTYGSSLVDLSEQRRNEERRLYSHDDEAFQHFTERGLQVANQCILDTGGQLNS